MKPEDLGLKIITDLEPHKPFYARWFKSWYPTPNKSLYYYLRLRSYVAAIDGDQSFAGKALWEVQERLLRGEPLDEADQWFLAVVISRVANNKIATNAICGREGKRGAGKRGYKGWGTALDVLRQLRNGAQSVEEAIAMVAERRNLSESMVMKYWGEWKDEAEEVFKLEDHLAEPRVEDQSKG